MHNFGLFVIPYAISDRKIGERICNMPWWVVDVSDADTDLLIADRPCLLEGNTLEGECVIALPLSPRKLLIISNDSIRTNSLRAMNITRLVDEINIASSYYSAERVYGTGRHHLPLVEKLLGFRGRSNVF